VWGAIKNTAVSVWDGMKIDAASFVDDMASVWDRLESIFKTPVNYLISTVYDNGIARLWNDVVGAIGLGSIKLPTIPALATGGVVPGWSPGRDNHLAAVSGGEGILTPQATQAVGGKGTIDALNSQYPSSGSSPSSGHGLGKKVGKEVRRHLIERPAEHVATAGAFAGGGIVGDVTGVLSGAAHAVGSVVSGALDVGKMVAAIATGNTAAFTNAASAVIGTQAAGDLGKIMVGIPKALVTDLAKELTGAAGTSTPGKVTGTIAQWFNQAVKLTGVGASWIPDLETIAQHESGDNPDAINESDSNAEAGDPSRGIMQTIMTTFLQYHQPGTSMNIYDPVANISAAIRYIEARYGTVANVPGIVSLGSGGSYVGYDSGGWLPPSGMPVNGLGKPEAVLTPAESAAFVAIVKQMTGQGPIGTAASPLAGGGGRSVNVTQQFIGSQLPTAEQKAAMARDLALALSGATP
jgi:hypothetical protein